MESALCGPRTIELLRIAFDPDGYAHISYWDSTNTRLKHAKGTFVDGSTSWAVEEVDNIASVGTLTSIACNSESEVYISYYDTTNTALKRARGYWKVINGTPTWVWSRTTVDGQGSASAGRFSSIQVDTADVVKISYYDLTNKDLKFASK